MVTSGDPPTVRLERQFELLERLEVDIYENVDDCHYLVYARGTFSLDFENEACWVTPWGSGVLMDAEADRDFRAITDALASDGLEFEFISVARDSSGHVGPGTFAVRDACTTYSYEGDQAPELEDGALETWEPIGRGWWLISSC